MTTAQTLQPLEARSTPTELAKTPEMAEAYGTALARIALIHDGAFAHGPFGGNDVERATELAYDEGVRIVAMVDSDRQIQAGGAMTIQYGTGGRVAKVIHLFRSAAAPKGSGRDVLHHMLDIASSQKCEHVIGEVLHGNLQLLPWYESNGFRRWYTDREGNVWIYRRLTGQENIDNQTPDDTAIGLDPYTWVEHESHGF